MDKFLRFGLIAAVTAAALVIPTRAASSETPPPVIEVVVSLTDLPPAVVNVSVPEHQPVIEFPELPAPVVNVDIPAFPDIPAPIVNVDIPQAKPEVVYKDREVERIVEMPACVDPNRLSHFDLANWLTVAYPGAQWGLSGSSWDGLTWHEDSPKPSLSNIIDAYLAEVTADC